MHCSRRVCKITLDQHQHHYGKAHHSKCCNHCLNCKEWLAQYCASFHCNYMNWLVIPFALVWVDGSCTWQPGNHLERLVRSRGNFWLVFETRLNFELEGSWFISNCKGKSQQCFVIVKPHYTLQCTELIRYWSWILYTLDFISGIWMDGFCTCNLNLWSLIIMCWNCWTIDKTDSFCSQQRWWVSRLVAALGHPVLWYQYSSCSWININACNEVYVGPGRRNLLPSGKWSETRYIMQALSVHISPPAVKKMME